MCVLNSMRILFYRFYCILCNLLCSHKLLRFVLYKFRFMSTKKKFSSRCRKKNRHLISTQKIVFCLFIFSFIATKKKHVTRKSVQSKTKGKFLHLRMLRVVRVTHPPSDNQLIPAYSRSFPSSLLRSPPTALARGFRKSSSSS